jgi:Ca2+-binding RTX toxin-like protein
MAIINGTPGNDTLIGTNDDDILNGFEGDDLLDGSFGFDYLDGGAGNDTATYSFYSGGIVANLQTDVVSFPGNSTRTETLVGIENVIGSSGNDTLIGGFGDNTLIGGFGSDRLTGSAGADKFVFNFLSQGIDVITDFSYMDDDKIQISQLGFGASSTSQFTYNDDTGALFFDASSSDSIAPVQFALLQSNIGAGFIPSLDIILV